MKTTKPQLDAKVADARKTLSQSDAQFVAALNIYNNAVDTVAKDTDQLNKYEAHYEDVVNECNQPEAPSSFRSFLFYDTIDCDQLIHAAYQNVESENTTLSNDKAALSDDAAKRNEAENAKNAAISNYNTVVANENDVIAKLQHNIDQTLSTLKSAQQNLIAIQQRCSQVPVGVKAKANEGMCFFVRVPLDLISYFMFLVLLFCFVV